MKRSAKRFFAALRMTKGETLRMTKGETLRMTKGETLRMTKGETLRMTCKGNLSASSTRRG